MNLTERTYEAVKRYPIGAHKKRIAAYLGKDEQCVSDALQRLKNAGLVVCVPDPYPAQPKRARWCLPENEESTRQYVKEHSGKKTEAGAKTIGDWGAVKSQVLGPAAVAKVVAPEKFFSALRPGQYPLPATCNAAKVLS